MSPRPSWAANAHRLNGSPDCGHSPAFSHKTTLVHPPQLRWACRTSCSFLCVNQCCNASTSARDGIWLHFSTKLVTFRRLQRTTLQIVFESWHSWLGRCVDAQHLFFLSAGNSTRRHCILLGTSLPSPCLCTTKCIGRELSLIHI